MDVLLAAERIVDSATDARKSNAATTCVNSRGLRAAMTHRIAEWMLPDSRPRVPSIVRVVCFHRQTLVPAQSRGTSRWRGRPTGWRRR